MNFAFLVHPLSEETRQVLNFDSTGSLKNAVGSDLLQFCVELHRSVLRSRSGDAAGKPTSVRVIDELPGLVSLQGAKAEGRLYEIPMDAYEILDNPTLAMDYMQEAVEQAVDWGAKIVGLGSMTGIVGGQGTYLAEHAPVPVTTGNSLTVYAALENLAHACEEAEVDLSEETVAVVGIPGSIATVAARLLASRCKSLLLVGRQRSARAAKLAEQLDAELLLDIPKALRRAGVIFSATSSGSCIEQKWLRSGSIVVDVAVPTDVQGSEPERDDVLIISGGLSKIPRTMSFKSSYLWFHQGMIPSCLAETTVLALENRTECYSLGRDLKPERVEEIGKLALAHGFDFSRLLTFGTAMEGSMLVKYRKEKTRLLSSMGNGRPVSAKSTKWTNEGPPTAEKLAPRAADLFARHLNPVLAALGGGSGFVKTFVKGEGTEICDADGIRYLDFVAGFGSLNLGHNHPVVVEAINSAMLHGAPGFAQSAVNPFATALAEQLATVSPGDLQMTFFANSGSEAVEAALKLARRATGRNDLVYCDRSYHGKTLGSLSVTGNPDYQQPFGSLLPGCRSVPYGDLELLERVLLERRAAAFLVEPIQAEGGMIVPPADYLSEAQRLCRKTDTLLIVDEVQTGMGRTGSMFAVDRLGVEPDLMTLAKSLGGGLVPIGAMLARRDLWMKAYGTIHSFALHTSTFGGGSLACAAGLATLKAIREEHLAENAAARGRQLREGLEKLVERSAVLREVRGEGLLVGLEFTPLLKSIQLQYRKLESGGISRFLVPNMDTMLKSIPAIYVMTTLLQPHRIYTQTTRSNPQVLRIQPPLTVSEDEIRRFLTALEECCGEMEFSVDMLGGFIAKSGMGQHQANGDGANVNGNGATSPVA